MHAIQFALIQKTANRPSLGPVAVSSHDGQNHNPVQEALK
jgi:hypothetical protein